MRPWALLIAAALACALAATDPLAAGSSPDASRPAGSAPVPTEAQCAAVRAQRTLAPVESYDAHPGALRVFAIQYKQDLSNVVTYTAFRTKIECLIRQDVLPRLARGRPNLVVFPEDTGLMTLATGSRGAQARRLFGGPRAPGCESQGAPCSTVAALGAITAAYGPQVAFYKARFPSLAPLAAAFVAATDTLVRSFMETFSDLARRYGIYIVASNDQAPFITSSAPADVALLHDPDQPTPDSVYVATSPDVHNEAFLWGPEDVRATGPAPLRNVVDSNLKVPLTPIELELGLTAGPSSGPSATANLRPYALPGTAARLGLATSLPAFVYGSLPSGADPCSNTSLYYMRCLDRLGANVVVQDEANPGRWTGPDADPREQWQPLSWMGSAYRAVSDPSVHFVYDVNAMMTGNLADLPFDGQSAITERGLSGPGCHYIGNAAFQTGEDRSDLAAYAGPQPGFVALAPWVSPDGSRTQLRTVGAQLAPGSGGALENDYAETAVVADLPIPADRRRAGCAAGPAPTHAQPPRRHRRHDRHRHRHSGHRHRHSGHRHSHDRADPTRPGSDRR